MKPEKIPPSDKKEGIGQLESYASVCRSCSFALWVGNEKLAFKTNRKPKSPFFVRIPDIPKAGDINIPIPTRKDLKPAVNLKQVFKRIHNYIYANQGLPKDKAFEELQKLIFIKVYDEQYGSSQLQFYVLPNEDISIMRQRLIKLFDNVKNHYKYIFHDNESINLNDSVLEYVVSELYNFSLVDTETDVKGEAYEQIVGSNLRGDRGEFFTPRTVCNMTIDIIFSLFPDEKLRSPGALKILDPATGTGGFLIACVQRIKDLFLKQELSQEHVRNSVRAVSNSNFYGIDFNPLLVKAAQMNMVMHGDGSSNIVNSNSLKNLSEWNKEAKKEIGLGIFDIVVTNPPFGANTPIDNPMILDQFELTTYKSNNPRKSLPPEQLFIERCLQFLKPGGHLGMVVPDNILSNPGLVWLREWILKKAYVIASIDLPVETFQPHVGVQTSILILKKKTAEQEKYNEKYEIFMAIPKKIGHDRRGNPIYKTDPEGKVEIDDNNQPIIDDQLPLVVETFKEWIIKKGMI